MEDVSAGVVQGEVHQGHVKELVKEDAQNYPPAGKPVEDEPIPEELDEALYGDAEECKAGCGEQKWGVQ